MKDNYDINTNGENKILTEFFKLYKSPIVFDVGCNKGEWSLCCQSHNKNTIIHAFEPISKTFELYNKKAKVTKSNNVALGNTNEPIKMFFYPNDSTITSKYWFPRKINREIVEVQSIKGIDYCNENKIERIDFLKIDTEGAEFEILKGFEDMLKEGKIDIIQFEYGYINVISHTLLFDFYILLKQYGYTIGKITQNGVNFKDYSFDDENWKAPNVLAVKSELTKFIDKIKLKENGVE